MLSRILSQCLLLLPLMLYTVQGKAINENAGAAHVYLCVAVCVCDYGQMGLFSFCVI